MARVLTDARRPMGSPTNTVLERPPRQSVSRQAVWAGRIALYAGRVVVAAVPLLLWQYAVDSGWVGAYVASKPTAIGARFWQWLLDGTLVTQVSYTLGEAVGGYVAGVVVGAAAGTLFATHASLARIYLPFMGALNAVPRLVLAPLFIVWFGFGPVGKIALVSTIVVFITFFSVYSGLKEVSTELVAGIRSLGASNLDVWRHVRLPAIVGRVIASMRVSVGLSIGAAIVGEFVGSAQGIGYLVAYGSNLFRSADVYAGLLAVVLIVAIVDYALRRLEGTLNRWEVT